MSDNSKELKLNVKIGGKDSEYAIAYVTESVDKFHTKYSFTVEGDLYNLLEQDVYFNTKGKYKVEGFRNGKAPKGTIERYYGKGVWVEDTLDLALESCYTALFKQVFDKEPLITRPTYEVGKVDLGHFEFSFTACIMPDITLVNYKGIEVEKVAPVEVTDEQLAAELKKEQDKLGCWEDISDRAVADGDTVTIDYSGSIDGVKFDGGTAEKQDLVIGSKTFIPGFEEQVIGMNIGEDRDITVTFPADYGSDKLAGKEAVFAIKLHGIKVKVLPELDDEFAKDASEDCDTLDQFKAKLTAKLTEQAAKTAERATESKLVEKLAEINAIEFPAEYEELIAEQAIRQELEQQGINLEMYLKYVKTTLDAMVKEFKESPAFKYAVDDEKVRLIMTAIVKEEKITAEQAEIEAKMQENADKAEKSLEDYKKEMKDGEAEYIANVIVNEKLRKFILDNNVIK